MKRVKRERKAKRAQRIVKHKKRNVHVLKRSIKPFHKNFIQEELFKQDRAVEATKTPEKPNFWVYATIIIIIIFLILFLIKFIPGFKSVTEVKKSITVIPSPTEIVSQQIIQKKAVTKKTKDTLVRKQMKVEIYFPLNKWEVSELSSKERDKLNILVEELLKDKFIQEISVYGHADRSGPRAYNLTVSEKRAQKIAQFLSEKIGIELNKIVIQGRGEILEGPDGVSNPLFRKVEVIKK